ncbi:MAG: leucine-rich repeat domain-containing protein [Paludibacter sp.]|nr:leucine-rich repeat domain-containing protein [Paludibacter sp.]
MKKIKILFLLSIIAISVKGQITTKIANVSTQGTLQNLITESEARTITTLTVTGNIDARDFAYMRDKIKLLSILDLSSSSIKAYTGIDGTYYGLSKIYPANELPAYSFYNPNLLTYKSLLTKIKFPNNITSLGNMALYYCWGLTGTLNIPASLKSIGDYALYGCTQISSYLVPGPNTRYSSSNGILFSKNQDTIIICPTIQSGDYSIPPTVKHIGSSAFEGCYNLTSVIIPSSVISIGSYAFSYCSGINGNLTLPNSVKRLDEGAFYGCYNLTGTVFIPASLSDLGEYCFLESNKIMSFIVNTSNPSYSSNNDILYSKDQDTLFICPPGKTSSLTIPVTVKLIGSYAFYKCKALTGMISIPKDVDYIGYYSFFGCNMISAYQVDPQNMYFTGENDVLYTKNKDRLLICPTTKSGTFNMPATVKFIDPSAFCNCSSLTGFINIPATVNSIGEYALYGCNQISGFNVDALNNFYSSSEGLLFNKNQDTLLICQLSKSGKYNIPSTVKAIGTSAFEGCLNLTEVSIPNSVTSIGNYAFEFCTGLTKINIPNNIVTIGSGAFYSCTNLQELTVAKTTPLIVDYFTFDFINKSICRLVVPIGSSILYKAAPYWEAFSLMSESVFDTKISEMTQSSVRLYIKEKKIFIEGLSSSDKVDIFTIQGKKLGQFISTGSTLSLQMRNSGIYIVRTVGSVWKIIL